MPIRDHFNPPIGDQLPWQTLLHGWAVRIADVLNGGLLPEHYQALEYINLHGRTEIDSHSFDGPPSTPLPGEEVLAAWSPPKSSAAVPIIFPESVEVRIRYRGFPENKGVVVLVTPSNKESASARFGLAARCVGYLQMGMSVVIVDVVTTATGSIHNEICHLLNVPGMVEIAALSAIAYRPASRKDGAELDIWVNPFAVGDSLPTMPLRLIADYFVPVDLEASYLATCRRRRLI